MDYSFVLFCFFFNSQKNLFFIDHLFVVFEELGNIFSIHILPVNGFNPDSRLTMIEGNPVTQTIPPSMNVECGATTRIGASALEACLPRTTILIPPAWYVSRPRKHNQGTILLQVLIHTMLYLFQFNTAKLIIEDHSRS